MFVFRTTKTGELPNISYVKRKPEPLGTEVKNIVDGISGSMLWIEIQEGKERMKNKEFQNLGSTAACTLRGVMATKDFDSYPVPALIPVPVPVPNLNVEEEDENNSPPHSNPQDPKRVWCGDSWFGSVKTASNIGKGGNHAIMQVKTAHARYPKKFLDA